MRLVSFVDANGPRVGALVGDEIVDLCRADPNLPASMREFIKQGERVMRERSRLRPCWHGSTHVDPPPAGDKALSAASNVIARGGSRLRAQDVRIAAPISDPEKIICVGLNYEEHIAESDASVAKVGVWRLHRACGRSAQPVPCRIACSRSVRCGRSCSTSSTTLLSAPVTRSSAPLTAAPSTGRPSWYNPPFRSLPHASARGHGVNARAAPGSFGGLTMLQHLQRQLAATFGLVVAQVVVIGRRCCNVAEAEALTCACCPLTARGTARRSSAAALHGDAAAPRCSSARCAAGRYVYGYTIGNDISARDWQSVCAGFPRQSQRCAARHAGAIPRAGRSATRWQLSDCATRSARTTRS